MNQQRSLFLASLALLLVPVLIWISGYHWQLNQDYSSFDYFLYIITQTSSAPIFAGISSFFFLCVLIYCCPKINWKLLLLVVLLILGGSQILKEVLKISFKEARPYQHALITQEEQLDSFFTKKRSERSVIVASINQGDMHTPQWLKKHWEHETGYSFPSGHTAFAASWLMIFVGFLSTNLNRRNGIVLSVVGTWTALMLVSRVRLGMHFPIDLFISCIMLYILSSTLFFILERYKYKICCLLKIK